MARESSLARQLRRLTAPQTNLLLQDRLRPSLLFEPREASGLDRDTIFAYGSTGFDKLMLVNQSFARFEELLFSQNSKTFERSVQTKTVNEKLDKNIDQFLSMLSPYVLLRGAHEALEWLIYRFHIHVFNTDSLIGCVLPHYHTRLFVRVIQLLDIGSDTNKWCWLLPVQKSGKPLELSVLIHYFNSDVGFRKCVCDLAVNIAKLYPLQPKTCQVVISFSTITTYYALRESKDVNDNLVTFLLPYIINGLKSNMDSYCSASYLIISTLAVNVKLTPNLIGQLVFKISYNVNAHLMKQALELIMLIYERQEIDVFPRKAFLLLLSTTGFSTTICELSAKYHNSKIVVGLIKSGIPISFRNEIAARAMKKKKCQMLIFISNLLRHAVLNRHNVQLCFNRVLNVYIKLCKTHQEKSIVKSFTQAGKGLLKALEVRWPDLFDSCIHTFFKTERVLFEEKRAWHLINITVSSLKHHMVPNSGLTLFLALNHANGTIRRNGIKTLLRQAKAGKVSDMDFLQCSLLNCMCDDDPMVAMQVLSQKSTVQKIFPHEQLFVALHDALKKNCRKSSSKHRKVCQELVKLLCSEFGQHEWDSFTPQLLEVLLPFLFPLVIDDICHLSSILSTPLAEKNILLKTMKEDCTQIIQETKKSSDALSSLLLVNHSVLMSVKKSIALLDSEAKLSLTDYFLRKEVKFHDLDTVVLFFSCFFAEGVLASEESDLKRKLDVTSALVPYINGLLLSDIIFVDEYNGNFDLKTVVESSIKCLRKNQIPLSSMCFVLHSMLLNMDSMKSNGEKWWPDFHKKDMSQSEQHFKVLGDVLFFFVTYANTSTHSSSFQCLMRLFFQHLFADVKETYWFLSHHWACDACNLQDLSLKIATAFCHKDEQAMDWFFQDASVVFPSLCVPLLSMEDNVRNSALNFLSKCLLPSCVEASPLKEMAMLIACDEQEIKCDHQRSILVVESWIAEAYLHNPSYLRTAVVTDSQHDTPLHVLNILLKLACDMTTPCEITNAVLQFLNQVNSLDMLDKLLPLLEHYGEMYKNSYLPLSQMELEIIQLMLQKFSVETAAKFTKGNRELDALTSLLKASPTYIGMKDATVQLMTLNVLSKEFFEAIPSPAVQKTFLDGLIDMYIESDTTNLSITISRTLSEFCTYAYLLLKDLPGKVDDTLKNVSLKQAKKARLQEKDSFSAEVLEKGPWKKITVVLELIQDNKHLAENQLLVPELFRILNLTLDWESQPSTEYMRQIILACIHNCCSQMEIGELDETKFQVEWIIQCIRSSENPQTHHQALIVLNLAAIMYPDYVLRNIMSIFTFMGTNLLRQDDSYSFQIISRTIETIVPALQQASSQQNVAGSQVMATIIRMFVDSIPDIPRHRQLPLFKKLINTLGSSGYLWLPLAQVCERYAYPSSFYDIYASKTKDKEISPTLEFAISLHEQFPLSVQLDTCFHLVTHLAKLPVFITEEHCSVKHDKIVEPFDITIHTDKQLQDYKRNVLCYMNQWLSSSTFIGLASEHEKKVTSTLEDQYKALLEAALSFLERESASKESTAHLPLLYDLLQNINSLLPCKLFIRIMRLLLSNPIPAICRQSIEILNAKLEYQPHFFQEDCHELLQLRKPLLSFLYEDSHLDSSPQTELIKQTALFAIHLMCKVLGFEHALKFHKMLPLVIRLLCDPQTPLNLLVNTLLCLGELCKNLNALVLPYVSTFMPKIIDLMTNSEQLFGNEYLALGLIATLRAIVENLGSFCGVHMKSILTNVCILSAKCELNSKDMLNEKLAPLRTLLSKDITFRIFLPSIKKSYNNLLRENCSAVGPLMTILAERISQMAALKLINFLSSLQGFYLQVLDFRSKATAEPDVVEYVEKKITVAVMALVMKLSESSFQSLFSEIYRWAVPSSVDKDVGENEARVFTFYRITHMMAQELKAIFVPFVKTLMRHSVAVLEKNNSAKSDNHFFATDQDAQKKTVELLNNILDTLNLAFQNDDGLLAEKECFDVLMQPLVDQIENLLGDEKVFEDRVENHLSLCLAHFVCLFEDSAQWKALNYQVLLKSRHSSPKVRFAALQVVREVARKMGDSYLVLLPESIPFLAEIMEDESLEVEQECQSVIMELEKILGEPIKNYL